MSTPRVCLLLVVGFVLALGASARGQTTAEERFKELTDLDELAEKLEKEKKNRPPFEVFRHQIAPFDVLPYYKTNHWNTLTLEMRSNLVNYEGSIQSASEVDGRPQVPLLDMPHAMIYRRDALLPKEQSLSRSFQVFLPTRSKQLVIELTRPTSIRADFGYLAPLQLLRPHQMLIPVLSADPSSYNSWMALQATVPISGDRDRGAIDRERYYRIVLPQVPERPNLSPHPLTWSTTSHVIWDGFIPENLTSGPLGQQQAMIDWIHWGGQLVVVAAGPNVVTLQDSFLGPYLPATASGKSATLNQADLARLSEDNRPPKAVDQIEIPLMVDPRPRRLEPPRRYDPPEAIAPVEERPLFLAGLEPKNVPGIVTYEVGDAAGHLLAIERRVGRGRILMLAFNPNDPALSAWRGMDTLIRRLILRRPEETWIVGDAPGYGLLSGPQLSWVRYVARDLGARSVSTDTDPDDAPLPGEQALPTEPVAAWLDTASTLPSSTRSTLEVASGITIPGSEFVLRVILAYIVALVPLNWLVCRFVFRRRELAWAVVPFLALGFAYGVERMAAYDVGFDSACDEIDVVEIQGTYPRAHVSRFASIYSTGRVRYEIAFPDDPSALALPMKSVEGLRGEQIAYSTFQSTPVPALTEFGVEPRSLAMFRAEAMTNVGGGVALEGTVDSGKVINGTNMALHDAVLIDTENERQLWLGEIAAWPATEEQKAAGAHEVALAGRPRSAPADAKRVDLPGWADLPDYLKLLREYDWEGPSDRGEVRLVAWADDPHPGQQFTPSIDRHRGIRLVVAHLRYGMPHPSSPLYYQPEPVLPPEDEPVAEEAAPPVPIPGGMPGGLRSNMFTPRMNIDGSGSRTSRP